MSQDEKQPGAPAQPAEEADLKERMENFNKELMPLLAKYELGIAAIPKIIPGGTISADPVVVSVRGKLAKPEKAEDLADPSK